MGGKGSWNMQDNFQKELISGIPLPNTKASSEAIVTQPVGIWRFGQENQ